MSNIIILGLTSLLTDVSSEMVYPLIAVYLSSLGATPAIIGFIEGIAESLASLLKVFSGYFSDKLKRRKPFAIFGYSFSGIGKFLLYISTTWHYVLFARIFDRFGKGVRTAPRDALIAESSAEGKKGKAFGLHRTMDTLGAASGVLLAYFFITAWHGSYKTVFLWSVVPAILGVAVLFFVKEKHKTDTEQKHGTDTKLKINFKSFKYLDKKLKYFLMIAMLFTLGNSSNQFLFLRSKNLGFSAANIILLYLVYNIVYAFVSYPAGIISDKIGRKKILVMGYFFYGLVYFGFAFASAKLSIWILFALYGLYIGLTEGIEKAFISDVSPTDKKATILGLHATIVGIGLFPASFLAGILWTQLGPAAPFIMGGLTGILSSFLLLFLI
ncbi:MAG: MFS transporter [Elusimicrobia bacterium CG06_land_8_20_14_3_00_38_11]|nr:MAG: MFS transporter [Elusimicrobia bacterium CG06_land_8_20_14_3_00_38_11]